MKLLRYRGYLILVSGENGVLALTLSGPLLPLVAQTLDQVHNLIDERVTKLSTWVSRE
jgi:hypothetical protein